MSIAQLAVISLSIILGLLAAAVLLRICLEAVLGRAGAGLPLRIVQAMTAPVVGFASALAPRIVPAPLVYAFAICWLLTARLLLHVGAAALGIRASLNWS